MFIVGILYFLKWNVDTSKYGKYTALYYYDIVIVILVESFHPVQELR